MIPLSYLNIKMFYSATALSTNHWQWLNHSFLLHFGRLLFSVFPLIWRNWKCIYVWVGVVYDLCLQSRASLLLHFLTSNCKVLQKHRDLSCHCTLTLFISFVSFQTRWLYFGNALASKSVSFDLDLKIHVIICRLVSNIKCPVKPCVTVGVYWRSVMLFCGLLSPS